MSLEQHKITQEEITQKGVVSAPDKLTGTARENKTIFDKLISFTGLSKLNPLIDELISMFGTVNATLVQKADKATTYTKVETDTALNLKADKATTYTKIETDTQINDKIIAIGAGDMAKAVYDTNNNGAVDAADKLQTARTINNVPFDGTADITIVDSTAMPKSGGDMTGALKTMVSPANTTEQARNMVVYPAGTDISTVNVSAGTIICILK